MSVCVWYNGIVINFRGGSMALSYNKLWKLLIDKGMTKTEMRLKADISTTTLAKMGKNETVSMDVLLRICNVLDCNVGDIMDVTKNWDILKLVVAITETKRRAAIRKNLRY